MDITLTATSKPESENYLAIIYDDEKYTLEDFAKKFQKKDDEFALDRLLKICKIEYKGQEFTHDKMCDDINLFCNSLPLTSFYWSKIYPREKSDIFTIDKDYFASGKLVKSAEDQLTFGRYSLIQSQSIIDFNLNCNWITGYAPIYYIRSIRANEAIMWYNNVFDSIMQIIFIAFGIYKKHPQYSDKLDYHKILKLCDYTFLSNFYGKNKTISNLKELWNIISKAQNANQNIKQWANYIKHKGGINFKGVGPDAICNATMINISGEIIRDTDFEPIQLELDKVIEELKNSHLILCDVLAEIVDFIGFEKVELINVDGNLIIPQKSKYKKVIID